MSRVYRAVSYLEIESVLPQSVLKDLMFRVTLNMYYLEHDADFSAEYDRRELAG